MGRKPMKRLAGLLILLLLYPTISFAQGRRGGARGGGVRGGAQMDAHTVLLLLTAVLDLNDSQQQQLGSIFNAAVITAAPIASQLETSEAAIYDAANSGKSDDEIKSLADQIGSLTSQMRRLQAQTFSKMLALLTSVQQSKVDNLIYDDIGKFLTDARPPVAGSPPEPGPSGAPR